MLERDKDYKTNKRGLRIRILRPQDYIRIVEEEEQEKERKSIQEKDQKRELFNDMDEKPME